MRRSRRLKPASAVLNGAAKVGITIPPDGQVNIKIDAGGRMIGVLVVDQRGLNFVPSKAKKVKATRVTWGGLYGLLSSGALEAGRG